MALATAAAAADALVFSRPPVRNGLTVVAKFQGRASPRSRLDDSCDGKEPLKEPFPSPSGARTNALRSNCSCLQAFLRRKGEKKTRHHRPTLKESVASNDDDCLLLSPSPFFSRKKTSETASRRRRHTGAIDRRRRAFHFLPTPSCHAT